MSVGNNIVLNLSHHLKYKSYTHDLSELIFENDMHATILDSNKLESDFLSRCVFVDIDKTQYYPISKLISALYNVINGNIKVTKLLILYNIYGYSTHLNDLQDEYYFTGSFLILFFYGDGKYLARYKTVIILL